MIYICTEYTACSTQWGDIQASYYQQIQEYTIYNAKSEQDPTRLGWYSHTMLRSICILHLPNQLNKQYIMSLLLLTKLWQYSTQQALPFFFPWSPSTVFWEFNRTAILQSACKDQDWIRWLGSSEKNILWARQCSIVQGNLGLISSKTALAMREACTIQGMLRSWLKSSI